MRFIYSCICDNTAENREHLKKIGVIHNTLDDELETNEWLISNYGMYLSIPSFPKELIGSSYPHEINCIGNPALFRAVTAMRDDSDYMQWYKTDFDNKLIPDVKEMYLCRSREFMGITTIYKGEEFKIGTAAFHKATLEELQQHFKHI